MIISGCMFLFILMCNNVLAQDKVKVKDDKTKMKEDGVKTKVKDDKTKVKDGDDKMKDKDDKTKVKDDEGKIKEKDDKTKWKDADGKLKEKDDKTKMKDDDGKLKEKDDKTKMKDDDGKLKEKDDKTKMKDDDGKLKEKDDKTKMKDDDSKMKMKSDGMNSPMPSPYTASYSSKFVIGNPAHTNMIVDMWKDWDENALDRHDYWSDTVSIFLPDGTVMKGKAASLEGAKKFRGSLASSKSTIDAMVPLRSTDRNEDWVAMWGTETNTWADGKVETRDIHEIWKINKDGKISMVRQFAATTPKQ